MEELISVIIPVYNVSDYIDEAIGSIIKQTGVNFEVIIVDDCSSDDTYEKVKRWVDKFDCIKVYKNKSNMKICKTLNFALSMSQGSYIARFDGDDISVTTRLEKQLKFLKENSLDLVGCQMIAINADGEHMVRGHMPIGIHSVIESSRYSSPIAHIWLAKRDVYDSLNGYREIPYAEDYDFILRALDMGYLCDNHGEHLMLIRHREGNTASSASLIQRKAHKYVLELHNRRVKHKSNEDQFNEDELNHRLRSWSITIFLHRISTQLLSSAYNEKTLSIKVIKTLLSCLLSYYNLEYLINRFLFKKRFT